MKFPPNIKVMAVLVVVAITTLNIGQAQTSVVFGSGVNTFDMDFVNIGNTSVTAGDTTITGTYGVVNYKYSIGTYEVTAAQWAAAVAADNNIGNAGLWSGSQPASGASWYESVKFANWLTSGNAYLGAYRFDANGFLAVERAAAMLAYETVFVLPTEDEWHKAAYLKSDGSGYTTFATGDAIPNGIGFSGDIVYDSVYSDGVVLDAPKGVGSGSMENNGTYDMGGNVWEMTESTRRGGASDPTESQVLRGGYFRYGIDGMKSSIRGSNFPDVEGDGRGSAGFRIAAIGLIPEPSSTALLALGGVVVMMRRRRS